MMYIRKYNLNVPAFDDDPPKDKVEIPEDLQEHVNSLLAAERKKADERIKATLDEVNALKTRSDLTQNERDELEERLKRVQQDGLTKEQQLTEELKKAREQAQEEAEKLSENLNEYKGRYENTLVSHAISSAAATHKAYNPEQLEAILRPMTVIEEMLDNEGKPTGNFEPRVNMSTKSDDGKVVVLKLSVDDAVKRMREEMPIHANLFSTNSKGGFGSHNAGPGGKLNIRELAKDHAAFKKAREEGRV